MYSTNYYRQLYNSIKQLEYQCKEVNYKVLGLSLATINFIISVVICSISIKYFINEKNK